MHTPDGAVRRARIDLSISPFVYAYALVCV